MGKKRTLELIQDSDPERCDKLQKKSAKPETSYILESVNPRKKKKVKCEHISTDPEGDEFSATLDSDILESVKPAKKKNVKSEPAFDQETDDSVPTESLKSKKLRFDIDGQTVESGKEANKEDKAQVKKVRKPRWSEERKTEERKRKASEHPAEEQPKIKKRKKHKRKKEPVNQKSSQDLPTLAIQYLQTWQYDRSSWKFSKFKQTWLLKNMFHLRKIPSSVFPVLVEYISSAQGGARLKTYEAASKMIQSLEEKASSEVKTEEEEIARCLTEDSEEDKEEIHQRARSILQALSDCT